MFRQSRAIWWICAAVAAFFLMGFDQASAEPPAYTGSGACTECHADAANTWRSSDHAAAWTEPTPETVKGDFNDASYEHGGRVSNFFRTGDNYFIETDDAAGARHAYPVVGVVGIRPLQQYLISPSQGRTQVYDVAWDTELGRWYSVFPDQNNQPGDGYHWTGPYKSWEMRCAGCHATGYQRNYDPKVRSYAPEMVEKSVGCEACHGPGQAHVDWARTGRAPAVEAGLTPLGLTVDISTGTPAQTGLCLACHSLREAIGDKMPIPGTDFHDSFILLPLQDGLYHADGSILSEVFEGGSFLQSKMHGKGVTCTNCHEPHSGRLRAEGNAVCTQCHSPAGNSSFPSLPLKVFDGPEHHFHKEGSPGAQCVSCHMPARTYMGVDDRRDHGFRIPRPDLATTGSPDACTTCHNDKDAAWAASEIEKRFPNSVHRGPSFATVFAEARDTGGLNVDALLDVAEWDGPGIVRASALDRLPDELPAAESTRVAALLGDPDPLVRAGAVGHLRGVATDKRLALLAPLFGDPLQSVRVAAAQSVIDLLPNTALPAPASKAVGEWQDQMKANQDFPEGQMKLGGVALSQRDLQSAATAFLGAVQQDPQLVQAWAILVQIYAAVGDTAAAKALLEQGLTHNPDDPALMALQAGLAGGAQP